MATENSRESSRTYRKKKSLNGFVAINKYIPAEMRDPLHVFIDAQIDAFNDGGFSATDLAHFDPSK